MTLKRQMTRKKPPKQHCEAFPSLDAGDVSSKVKGHEEFDCVWRDEIGTAVGVSHFKRDPDGVQILHRVFKDFHILHGQHKSLLKVDFTASKVGGYRARFICPSCGNRVGKLYCSARDWACRDCSNLIYTSQRVTRRTRQTIEYEVLNSRVGRGRPKGMHQRIFDRDVSRMKELEKELNVTGTSTPNLVVSKKVTLEWRLGE